MTTKISTDNIQQTSLELLSGGAGITVYETLAELPLSGNETGDKAYVKQTTRLYLWNGVGWFNIALINTNPSITVGPDSTYVLYGDGTPTVIELTATDPEGIPITWSHQVTSGSLGGTTVTNVGNVFTITPGDQSSDAGEFTLTFTASDGVNIDTAGADLRIRFGARDPYYISSYTYGSSPVNDLANKTFIDQSENAFTVTPTGNVTQGTRSPYSPAGWSGSFDGSGDYLALPANSAFGLGSSDFTIEAWVFQTSAKTVTVFARWPTGGVSVTSYIFRIEITGKLGIAYNIGGEFNGTSSTNAILYNRWNHIAWVRNGNTLKYFINGVEDPTSVSLVGSFANPLGAPLIGLYNTSVDTYFNGYISNLRAVVGTALYTENFTPPTEPLTAVSGTSLLTLQDNRFKDNSTNNFTITRAGDTAIAPVSPFASVSPYNPSVYGGSAYFDGAGDYLTWGPTTSTQFGTGDFTVEFWTMFYNANGTSFYFLDNRNSSQTASWCLLRLNTNALEWYSGTTSFTVSNFTPAPTWNHIAVTRSGTTLRIFINGVESLSATDTTDYSTSSTTAYIGCRYSIVEYLNGFLSNLRIVKGTAVYTENFTPPTAPVTAIANTSLLLNFANAGIYEESGRITIETFGNARSSNAVVKTSNTSMYFDGTGDYCIVPAEQNVGSGDFTIEAWVYPTAWTGTWSIIYGTRASNGNSTTEWGLGVHNTGYPYIYSNAMQVIGTAGQVSLNTWTHLAATKNGGSGIMRLFVNGALVDTETSSQNYTTAAAAIGANRDGSEPWTGYISDLRLTKGRCRYATNFTPSQNKIGFDQRDTDYSLLFGLVGQAEYTTPGTYTWTAPAGVTNVSVVCVGGGGGGGSTGGSGGGGGGGGGLGWKNNIPVVPGQSYTVVVGVGGARDSATHGGDSYFIDTSTVAGLKGLSSSTASGGAGGGYVGDGGGNGGTPNASGTSDSTGGGGAGGYSGNGGGSAINQNGYAGSGGGGGGGAAGGSSDAASGGGGVGIYGEGASGVPGVYNGNDAGAGGGGGSGGQLGGFGTSFPNNNGGNFGGGGGGAELNGESGAGAGGAVRIIWGPNRAFPSTNTQDM